MRKKIIKQLVPIIILFLLVGMACYVYTGRLRQHITEEEVDEMADVLCENLDEADLIIKTVIDYNDMASLACSGFNMADNRDEIVGLLDAIVDTAYVEDSIICNIEGKGFDSKGASISLKDDKFFSQAASTYSRGGSGLVFISDSNVFKDNGLAVVNHISFNDQNKGFLISILYVDNLAEILFGMPFESRQSALVSLSGVIIAEPKLHPREKIAGNTENAAEKKGIERNFWDEIPDSLPVDTIKLNISQKTRYSGKLDDGSYVIVVPSKVTTGAAVTILDESNLLRSIKRKESDYNSFMFEIFSVLFIFVGIMMAWHFAEEIIKKNKTRKILEDANLDNLTGLYNGRGTIQEINKYIDTSRFGKGLIFALAVEDFAKMRQEKGNDTTDRITEEFAERLSKNYRVTDIVGRVTDDEFVIFMKDIYEEKDIRKQVDELQLFLYDLKNDVDKTGIILNVSVGGAIYPRDGKNARQLQEKAEEAMKNAQLEGNGRISFYK